MNVESGNDTAAIWHCLNHYAFVDATFLAERLLAEVKSDESLFLVATAYYRAGKPGQVYSLLQRHNVKTPQLKYLFARCCWDLGKLDEAESIISGSSVLKPRLIEEVISQFGPIACFALQLLGLICSKTERPQKAIELYKRSLKLNPFLWHSFIGCCDLGEKVDSSSIFKLDSIDTFANCHGDTIYSALNNAVNSTVDSLPATPNLPVKTLPENHLTSLQVQSPIINSLSPLAAPINPLLQLSHNTSQIISYSPLQTTTNISTPFNPQALSCLNTPVAVTITPVIDNSTLEGGLFQAPKKKVWMKSMLGGPKLLSPLSPSFGILPIETPTSGDESIQQYSSYAIISPSPLAVHLDLDSSKVPHSVEKRILCRNTKDSQIINKPAVFAPAGNNSNYQSLPVGQGNVRRSSRLFGNSNSVKENNKNRFVAPKLPARKSKTRSSKNQSSLSELNEKNKSEIQDLISPEKTLIEKPCITHLNISNQIVNIQKLSADGLMSLLRMLGLAYSQASQYNCQAAINTLSSLPPQHYNTAWVLSLLGKCYFEMNNYQQSVKYFSDVRQLDPHFLHLMEYYSTALWHLQKEFQLSALAQDLVEEDREAPQSWCAAGNCFSLQKEHEAAIKFFSRAIQVDSSFVYAYTLLGHEHIATEELERALSCYRSAVRIDPRHYNAWYGIGLVLYKQERFVQAESYFKKALCIHPSSSVLMCHVAVVQHALQKSTSALATLNMAMAVDPKNALCKYHKASVLHSCDRNQEALEELKQLKEIVPKESNVYFLLAKVYKKLQQPHLALMNLSWAMDLDPKGTNNQFKEAIDPVAIDDEDDDATNNNPHENESESSSLALVESSQESLILDTNADYRPLPAMESLSEGSL